MVIPMRGVGESINLINSSRIRSEEIIEIRPAIFFIASTTSSSNVKSSCAANLAARIIRSGSSLNDCSALAGVRIIFFAKSSIPLNGSMNSGLSVVNSRAIAFIVKSRRDKSPSIESPYSTSGFRESSSYFSLRYVVTSTVVSPRFPATVPKAIPVSQTCSAHAFRIFFVSSGWASVVKSRSFPSRPKIASRTGPPTSARRKPFALNALARELASGARSTSDCSASSRPKMIFSLLTIDKPSRVLLLHDPGTWCGQRSSEEKA